VTSIKYFISNENSRLPACTGRRLYIDFLLKLLALHELKDFQVCRRYKENDAEL